MPFDLLTVTADGEITIPAELSRALGVSPGDRVSIERAGSSLFVRNHEQSVVDRVFGAGRRYAQIPPMSPADERRWFENAVGEENWEDLQRQALDWERDRGKAAHERREEG